MTMHNNSLRASLIPALRSGLELALFRRVTPSWQAPSALTLTVVLALGLGIDLVLQLWHSGWPSVFYSEALYYAATLTIAFLLASVLVGIAYRGRVSVLAFAVLVAAGGLLPHTLSYLYLFVRTPGGLGGTNVNFGWYTAWGVYVLTVAWYFAVVWRALGTLQAGRMLTRTLTAVAFCGLVFGVQLVTPSAYFWYPEYVADSAVETTPDVNVEDVYYAQSALLEQAFSNLERGTDGQTDLFVLGYAGYASQDVFMNEVNYVANLFAQRFGAGRRTLKLVNNRATLDSVPLANAPNLAHSVNALAERMNAEEDVLLLFATSHGARNATLSNRFWPLDLNDLEASRLRELLDSSGAKWRILVISACYSGSFIDALRDPYTLVITASAADRNSFGCGADSEFTYFGRHFFTEALANTASFTDAFEQARQRITERELEEGRTPSQPQLVVGDAMRDKLAELERGARVMTSGL